MTKLNEKYETITGTEGGPYIVFAVRGGFALGVKPLGFKDGQEMHAPGSTWFGIRVRAAKREKEDHSAVVTLADTKLEHAAEAFPNVEYDKKKQHYASCIMGTLIQIPMFDAGMPSNDLIQKIESGQLGREIAETMINLASAENLVMTKSEIAAALNEEYLFPVMKAMKEQKDASAAIKAKMIETGVGGSFVAQGALLKEVYASLHQGDPETPEDDQDGADDPDEDDEDNTD